jgi:glycosyltransferase involved in cell wall biosynthesis
VIVPETARAHVAAPLGRVAFVVPCFNGGPLLRTCIESILAATGRACDVVVVDDGSTEDIRSVVEDYAQVARYARQVNQGPAAARNLGVRLTDAPYIRFLDADDYVLGAACLLRQVAVLDNHSEVAIVHGQAIKVDASGRYLGVRKPPFAHESYIRDGRDELADLLFHNHITTSSTLVRRTALEAAGGFRTDLANDIAEDWECWMRLSLEWSVAYLAEPVAAYRVHAASAMANHARVPRLWLGVHLDVLDTLFADSALARRYGRLRPAVEARMHLSAADVAYRGQSMGVVRDMAWRALRRAVLARNWRVAASALLLTTKASLPLAARRAGKRLRHDLAMPDRAW